MKFISLFSKTPQHKRFSYDPLYYNAETEERRQREERIRRELQLEREKPFESSRMRIAGSFRAARKPSSRQGSPSVSLMRLIILTFLSLWVIGVFEFGTIALYGILLVVPFYFFLRFRGKKR